MTTTLTPLEAHEKIAAAGKSATPDLRVVPEIAVGEWVRQGDVYLERICKRARGWKISKDQQLAPGTSQGSRHVAAAPCKVYRSEDQRPVLRLPDGRVRLLGPQISSDQQILIEHPEHGHIQLPPGDYQVSFQTDHRTQQAVRD